MAPRVLTAVAAVVAAVTGAVVGAGIRGGHADREQEALRQQLRDRVQQDRATEVELGDRIRKLQAAMDGLHRELAAAQAREKAALESAKSPPPVEVRKPEPAQAERLAADARSALARKDGAAVLAAVRALAAVVPDGRAPAMGLVAELHEAKDQLGIGDVAWGAFLAAPAVTELLAWSIGHPSPEGFRELAAEVLPELSPPDSVTALYRDALKTEKDEDVSRAMVEGLIALGTPGADAVLLDLFRDAQAPVPVRVRVATHLARSGSAETLQALRSAAEGAPPALAAGLRAALSAGDAPEAGFLVTGFVDGSLRHHGLEPGDLLLTYDGRRADEELEAAIRGALGRDGTVRVEVLRGGAREALDVKPGWLGLIGLVVHARKAR